MTNTGSPTIVLEAGRTDRQYWIDLWEYRELFAILAWRDVAIRYKQTIIGISWALIRPVVTVLVFTIIFGAVAKMPSEGNAPYPLLVFAGMLPWFLFSSILGDGSTSLISNSNLISKVYFPRMIIPIAASMVALVDFGINLILMALFAIYYGVLPGARVLFLPLLICFTVAAAFGPTLIFSSLNVKYRDFRYIIPFVLQFGLYASPVGFSTNVVAPKWQFLYGLNPMVTAIDGFRWCLLGGELRLRISEVLGSMTVVLVLLWLGVRIFRRTERAFADVI